MRDWRVVAATVLRRPEWSTGQVSRQRVRTAQVQRIGRDLHMNAPDGARNGQHRRQGDLRGRVDDEREINKNHSTQVPQSPSCLSLPTIRGWVVPLPLWLKKESGLILYCWKRK